MELDSWNIWKIISLISIFFIAGWALANLFYKERIEILKAKNKENKNSDNSEDEFIYPETGKNGKNILANSTITIKKGEKTSLKAIIPNNEKLVIELKGPKPISKDDMNASWVFSLGKKRNWATKTYEPENGGRQEFDTESGTADMKIEFKRIGEVIISVFEGDKRSNTWTKKLNIRDWIKDKLYLTPCIINW